MKKKVCTKCKEEKLENEFYNQKNRKSGASYCKGCFNTYCMNRWTNKKLEAIKYKGSKCIDCGLESPHSCIYDFHHLDPETKDYDWKKLRLRSNKDIKSELDKCILLCSNCHRIRHSNS